MATRSDGHVHPKAHMLVVTLAQVPLQEQQGTDQGLTTAIEPAAAQLHGQGQIPWELCQVASPSSHRPLLQDCSAPSCSAAPPCPWVMQRSYLHP